MKLTLDQVKQNFLERFISETVGEGSEEMINELKQQLDEIETIEQMSPLFDDGRFDSWDVHSIIQFCLECCCQE
jgi:hypothetical protein